MAGLIQFEPEGTLQDRQFREAVRVSASRKAGERARALGSMGFAPLDALHRAFAEQSGAKWFLTTDDRLLRRASAHPNRLHVEVLKPDEFQVPAEGDQE
jgi:predicted nucleic acid-binding protein